MFMLIKEYANETLLSKCVLKPAVNFFQNHVFCFDCVVVVLYPRAALSSLAGTGI